MRDAGTPCAIKYCRTAVGAALTQREVVFTRAALVALAFDGDRIIGVFVQPLGLLDRASRDRRRGCSDISVSKYTVSPTFWRKSPTDPGRPTCWPRRLPRPAVGIVAAAGRGQHQCRHGRQCFDHAHSCLHAALARKRAPLGFQSSSQIQNTTRAIVNARVTCSLNHSFRYCGIKGDQAGSDASVGVGTCRSKRPVMSIECSVTDPARPPNWVLAEEHQHPAVGRPGRPFDQEAVGQHALAAAVRPHDADAEAAARDLGEGDIVAARRPHRRGVAALAEADALLAAAARRS